MDGDKGKMQRQLEDKLDVEDTTKSIAHIEVNPNSLLGKAIEDSYYYNEEDGLLDLNSIVERQLKAQTLILVTKTYKKLLLTNGLTKLK